jgi:hypothetical protein
MSAQETCNSSKMAVQLDVTNGETILYQVSFTGAQGVFAIVDQHGVIILDNSKPTAPGTFEVRWPGPNDNVKIPDDLNHVLGMHFISAVTYTYKVNRCDAAKNPIEDLKDCTYTRSAQTDSFFVPLRIFTV